MEQQHFQLATDNTNSLCLGKIDLEDDYGWKPILVGDNFDPNDDVQANVSELI